MDNHIFPFDGISYKDWLTTIPSNTFLKEIKDVDKHKNNKNLDFSWIKTFVENDK